jgi:hypothetical protein
MEESGVRPYPDDRRTLHPTGYRNTWLEGEVAQRIVLHYDGDFERIAEVTGQPAE